MNQNKDELLTYKEAAAILGLSHTTISKWVKIGAIKMVAMPGSSRGRIRRSTLFETLQQMERWATDESQES
jgi:excisionase family DNA binding protein